MADIEVINVSKLYKIPKRESGFIGTVKTLFTNEYDYIEALNNISFTANKGDAIGILGMNGAGKSTLTKLLCGIIEPKEGKILIEGRNPFNKDNDFLKKITLVSGNKSQMNYDLSCYDNFLFLKGIYDLDYNQFKTILTDMADKLGCTKLFNKQVRSLSFGERIKTEIIGSLLHNPQYIFLDEPTIGLDVKSQFELRNFLKEYSINNEKILIITSHNLTDIAELCNKILLIDSGNMRYFGSIEEFCNKYNSKRKIELTIKSSNSINKIYSILNELVPGQFEFDNNIVSILIESHLGLELSKKLLNEMEHDIEDIKILNFSIEDIIRNRLLVND